jgi:hypothetical protein
MQAIKKAIIHFKQRCVGKRTTIHSKMLEKICNKLSTHPYKCMKTIIIHLKAHIRKKWEKKTYDYKTSSSTYGFIFLDFNDKLQYVAKDIK